MAGNDISLTLGARELLARSAQEASAARASVQPSERFLHAHMAALRAAAALVARPGSAKTARSRHVVNVWDALAGSFPGLEAWAEYFRASASWRERIEAGIPVGQEKADELLGASMDFTARVRSLFTTAQLPASPVNGVAAYAKLA